MPPSILIAGTSSNVGKTTVSIGIMAVLSKKYIVQPFKVGPDFIDPSHHTKICSRHSRNLDSFMMGEDGVKKTWKKASYGADFCIIEGVMGLYDGLDSTEIASSSHIAKILDVPIILVVNAHGASRSIAAIVKGFIEFDNVNIQGIILNNVGSERHIKLIKDSLLSANIKIPIIGGLPKNNELSIPSRHLGLYMADEDKKSIDSISEFIEKHIDIEAIKTIARNFKEPNIELNEVDEKFNVKIGIAYDSAFCFYYYELFEYLRKKGAEIVFFSPINGEIPEVDCLYIGGGYPELYAKELEASKTRKWIKKSSEDGMPIYGECGGLLYLNKSLDSYKMVGIFDANSRMTKKLQALGYTDGKVVCDSFFVKKGNLIKGHEFHYSITECDNDVRFAYKLKRGKGIIDGKDGLIENNSIASYMHVHPSSFWFDEFLKSYKIS